MPKFLTPPDHPSETVCRTLTIPSDKLWLGIFNKALLETIYYWNWKQVYETDLTPEEAAFACWEILNEYWETTNNCEEMVDAPFYDDEEDVDDEEELGEQTWYDAISDWIISGFLAITFTPAAAIAYNATIPRIRLAIKTGNAGTIIRVIFGSVDILYDTFNPSPSIEYLELDFAGEETLSAALTDVYPLRIEHTGTHNPEATPTADGYYAQIVKGDLRPPMAGLTGVRQNEEEPCILESTTDGEGWTPFADLQLCPPKLKVIGGVMHYTPDDGVTWIPVEVETYDPIYTDPPPPNPRPETPPNDRRCSAAYSALTVYTDLANRLRLILEPSPIPFLAAGTYSGVLQTQLNFFMSGNFFNDTSANAAFQLNATSYFAALTASAVTAGMSTGEYFLTQTEYATSGAQEALRCALYCAMDDNGQLSYADALEALNDPAFDFPAPYVTFIELLGAGGLSAAISAHANSVPASACEECDCPEEWCFEWDSTALNAEWELVFGSSQGTRFVYMDIGCAATTITYIYFTYTWNGEGGGGTAARAIWAGENFGELISFDGNLAPLEANWEGSQVMTGVTIGVNANSASSGIVTITSAKLRGTGDCPFGEPNCEE